MTDLTPGDHWYKLFGEACLRMGDKKKCVNKFNKFPRKKQIIVYRDTAERQKHVWEDKEFIPGPYRYLNSEVWAESPIVKPKKVTVRDTTNEEVNQIQDLHGLKNLLELLKMAGGDCKPIQKQIEDRIKANERNKV